MSIGAKQLGALVIAIVVVVASVGITASALSDDGIVKNAFDEQFTALSEATVESGGGGGTGGGGNPGEETGGGGTGGGGDTGGGEMKTITAGTYTFNDTLATPANTMIENVALTFSGIDAGDTIGTIQVNNTNMVYGVSDDPTGFYIAYHYTGGWSTEYPGQKTVTITSDATVSEAFYNWFTANATAGSGGSTGTGASAPMLTAAVGTVVTGGTFKCNGTTVAPASNPWASDAAAGGNLPAYASGNTYTFGDSSATSADNLKWLKVSDTLFVCDRNLLRSISYDNISAMGFVDGSTTVTIDGNTYKIRLLEMSEWMATDCIGGGGAPFADNSVSHWENCFSWTKTPGNSDCFCMCGYGSASHSNRDRVSDDVGCSIGFRPALELVS